MKITRDENFEQLFLYKEIYQQISYIVFKPVNIYVWVQNGLGAQPPACLSAPQSLLWPWSPSPPPSLPTPTSRPSWSPSTGILHLRGDERCRQRIKQQRFGQSRHIALVQDQYHRGGVIMRSIWFHKLYLWQSMRSTSIVTMKLLFCKIYSFWAGLMQTSKSVNISTSHFLPQELNRKKCALHYQKHHELGQNT